MMGEAHFAMRDLGKTIDELCCAPLNMQSAHHVELVGSFYRQWTMICIDLHYVGATLNLRYAHSPDVDINEVRQGFLSAITRLLPNPLERTQACKEYLDFKRMKNGFEMASTFEGQLLSHKWWELFGSCALTLKPIAVRVLSQICSASSCERNWSNYGFVHSKSRNRLSTKRGKVLVYVFSNLKLQRKRCGNKLVVQTRVEGVVTTRTTSLKWVPLTKA